MTEHNINSVLAAETNIDTLKEALCVQQRLLQKLYNELDVEREAAATAASEALSMILRLQGEKAAVKMEAEQYKRLAEEKMNYAEESMEIFEEVMYQKEMEIAYLEYQVQGCRDKLVSLGYDDLVVNEIKFPENLLPRSESLVGETNPPENTTKRNPTPPVPKRFKLPPLKKGTPERERSMTDSDTTAKGFEENLREDENYNTRDLEKMTEGSSSGDINAYLEQIRKLDRIVEEVAGAKCLSLRGRSARSSSVPCNLNELNFSQSPPKSSVDKISSDACSSGMHDVFEVPQADGKLQATDEEKSSRLPKIPQDARKSHARDGTSSGKKTLPPKHKDKKAPLPRDGSFVNFHLLHVQPTKVAEPEHTTTEISEGEGENVRQDPVTDRGEQELRLLYEIREKLDVIQSAFRRGNTKTKKSSPNYNLPMLRLTEEMLHFWC